MRTLSTVILIFLGLQFNNDFLKVLGIIFYIIAYFVGGEFTINLNNIKEK